MEASPQPQRVCFVLRIRPERAADYAARHAAVWSEMREALIASGWRNYSIFKGSEGLIVGYLECDDFAAAVAAMQDREVNARWQAQMTEFFVLPDGRAPDLAMQPLSEIFHLD